MRAFTLIELLLTVAIIALIAMGGISVHNDFVSDRAVRSAVSISAAAIRVAQEAARAQYLDDTWSVRIASTSATVFRGDDWTARLEDYDSVYAFEFAVPVSVSESVFYRMTGYPTQPRTIVFHRDALSMELSLDSYGRIFTR